jgi:hypothetical protein
MGFIDTLQAEGYAVESICRVLREQGCQIAARTYRAWRAARQPAARTVVPPLKVAVTKSTPPAALIRNQPEVGAAGP